MELKYKISDLRTFYELRKSHSHLPRKAQGRVFIFEDRVGLSDASGVLWPIYFEHEKDFKLFMGDMIYFEGNFVQNKENSALFGIQDAVKHDDKKYSDHSFGLFISTVTDIIPCLEEWKNPCIENPLPFNFFVNEKKENVTYFFLKKSKRLENLRLRNTAIERTKQFFSNRGFLHIEAPCLVPSGGMETYLNCFVTEYIDHKNKKCLLQLPTSPEFALKKILAEGHEKLFSLARAFRNQGEVSVLHEPEFMMLEWYRAGAYLKDILIDTQKFVCTLASDLGSTLEIPDSWEFFRVDELFHELLKLDLNQLQDTAEFYVKSKNLSLSLRVTDTWDDIFCKLFMEKIEPFLKQKKACFVTHYPRQMSALAAQEKNNQNFVERGEAYLYGVEICNGYFELVDTLEFFKRLQHIQKIKGDEFSRDVLFENAMKFGLPSCAGNALGFDRVVMLLMGLEKISDLYSIPFLGAFEQNKIAHE